MTIYQLHCDGDCGYGCPVCEWEEWQVGQELAEEQAPPE